MTPKPHLTSELALAIQRHQPIVALESTVITHGLPHPQNLELAREMESTVRAEGSIPATIAIIEGEIRIGLGDDQLQRLALGSGALKISLRDFAAAIVQKKNGGTTVAGTMFAAQMAGINVFATGGIGGVHRESRWDVSTDLQALSNIPMIVVCAGAKSILDLPSTLEYLETLGVPVIGYRADRFPAFFSISSGLPVSARMDSPEAVAEFAHAHWSLGMKSAVLVCQPVPNEFAWDNAEAEAIEEQASAEAIAQGVRGQAITPFLLKRVNELSRGKSMRANLALLKNNAKLAAQIAKAMHPRGNAS
jgi:pseudouridine-5'-phosphate glycosidase